MIFPISVNSNSISQVLRPKTKGPAILSPSLLSPTPYPTHRQIPLAISSKYTNGSYLEVKRKVLAENALCLDLIRKHRRIYVCKSPSNWCTLHFWLCNTSINQNTHIHTRMCVCLFTQSHPFHDLCSLLSASSKSPSSLVLLTWITAITS